MLEQYDQWLAKCGSAGLDRMPEGLRLMEEERAMWLKLVLHSVRQQGVCLAGGAVQGPATRAGRGLKPGHAGDIALALFILPGLHN